MSSFDKFYNLVGLGFKSIGTEKKSTRLTKPVIRLNNALKSIIFDRVVQACWLQRYFSKI